MRARQLLALLSVPVVLLLERLTYYGCRSVLVLYMIRPEAENGLGLTHGAAMELYGWFSAAIMLTPALGGLAGLIVGPRIALPVGMAIEALGFGLLAVGGSGPMLYLGLGTLVLGQALFRPNLFTLLGQALPDPEDRLRSAGMMLAYAAINVGAILAPLTIGSLATRSGFGVAFVLVTGIAGVATVFSVGLSFADSRLASAPVPSAPLSVLGVAAVGALFALPHLTNTASAEGLHSCLTMAAPENQRFLLLSLNPWMVLGTVGLLVVLLLVLHASRRRLPALRLLGGGAVFATLSTLPLLRYGMEFEGLVAGLVLGAVAEVLIFPVALSRVSGVASPRIAALLVGFFLSWVGVLNHGANAMGRSDGAGIFLGLFALGSLGIGGVLLVLGGKLEQRLFAPAPAPTSPADAASLAR